MEVVFRQALPADAVDLAGWVEGHLVEEDDLLGASARSLETLDDDDAGDAAGREDHQRNVLPAPLGKRIVDEVI
jgi:hypothetical protein